MNIMNSRYILRLLAATALSFVAVLPSDARKKSTEPQTPKYVFYFIGDGMGVNSVMGAEMYNAAMGEGPQQINFNHFPVRTFITTHCASTLVTDSAAAGTALATGVKTTSGAEGVDPSGAPVSNLAEWAHAAGYGTGVATSVGVNHATPAAFYAHTPSRNNYNTIASQLIAADFMDFAAGAGFLTESKAGVPASEFEQRAAAAGITVRRGAAQFKDMASVRGRVLCMSADPADTELKYAIDRQGGETRLADFTKAGIDYLYSHHSKGFFFMVEGGKIDYAAHNDDGVTTFHEINDFAESVDLALAFYEEHPDETLIIVTADHETGGLILGSGEYAMHAERSAAQKVSENTLTALFRETFKAQSSDSEVPSWEDVKAFFTEYLGMWDTVKVDPRTEAQFKATYESTFVTGKAEDVVSLYAVNSKIVSDAIDFVGASSGFAWSHGSHSGTPVGLYVKGVSAAQFISCQDNTDVPETVAALAGYKK